MYVSDNAYVINSQKMLERFSRNTENSYKDVNEKSERTLS